MISVIIPAYNAAPYLAECMDSVLAQTHADLEVIVVDDGSADGTADVARRYAADPRVRLLSQSNRGVSAARNAGIDAARGERLFFIDADDVIVPDCLSTLLSMAGEDDISLGPLSYSQDVSMRSEGTDRIKVYTPVDATGAALYQRGIGNSACCMLIPAALMRDIRFREGLRYEDLELLPRLFMACHGRIVTTGRVMYLYRAHKESFINTFDDRRLDVLTVVDEIERRYDGHPVLAAAARDRRFSANFNMFVLCSLAGMDSEADSCWKVIREYRRATLTNPRVRLKNKLGAAISYLGRPVTLTISRLFYS